MARVVPVAALALDEVGHSPGGPKTGAISQDFGAFLKPPAQGVQLLRLEPGFASRAARLPEPGLAPLLPLLMPAARRFPGNPRLASHFGLAPAPVKEGGRTEPALFQLVEVALHTSRIAHAQEGNTGKTVCHYIIQHSIGHCGIECRCYCVCW